MKKCIRCGGFIADENIKSEVKRVCIKCGKEYDKAKEGR